MCRRATTLTRRKNNDHHTLWIILPLCDCYNTRPSSVVRSSVGRFGQLAVTGQAEIKISFVRSLLGTDCCTGLEEIFQYFSIFHSRLPNNRNDCSLPTLTGTCFWWSSMDAKYNNLPYFECLVFTVYPGGPGPWCNWCLVTEYIMTGLCYYPFLVTQILTPSPCQFL